MVLVARRAVRASSRRGFMLFSVARTTRQALGALPNARARARHPGPATDGRGRGTLWHLPCPPGAFVTCGARAGPGPCARPALGRAAHGAASRSVVQAHDHGPSAVPAEVARGSPWGPSLLTCGRPHAPSSQMRCWGPMVGVRRVRRRVAWFMLSVPTAAPSPGAAVGHTTNGGMFGVRVHVVLYMRHENSMWSPRQRHPRRGCVTDVGGCT